MPITLTKELPANFAGALCVLGRGIEQVPTRGGLVWRPTRYIEVPTARGGHTGHRLPSDPNDAVSLIAGANANLLAAVELYQILHAKQRAPRLVIFAAGRGPYLRDDPDPLLTEGRVLRERFLRAITLLDQPPEAIILAANRDTQDDVEATLTLVAQREINGVAMITVDVHCARVAALAQHASEHEVSLEVVVLPAERLLAQRYARRRSVMHTLLARETFLAFQRTLAREQRGVTALRDGTYGRSPS